MGYSLKKRITAIQESAERDDSERIGFLRTLVLCVIVLGLFAHYVLERNVSDRDALKNGGLGGDHSLSGAYIPGDTRNNSANGDHIPGGIDADRLMQRLQGDNRAVGGYQDPTADNEDDQTEEDFTTIAEWHETIKQIKEERGEWLQRVPFIGGILRDQYFVLVDGFISYALSPVVIKAGSASAHGATRDRYLTVNMRDPIRFPHIVASSLAGFLFVVVGIWPLCAVVAIAVFFGTKAYMKLPLHDPILSICDRGRSPFYSGIYGPLKTGQEKIGPDMSCHGLAAPDFVKKSEAISHPITKILGEYGALNKTTLSLMQIVLAYRTWPSYVEEERSADSITSDSKDETTEVNNFNAGYANRANNNQINQTQREQYSIQENIKESLPALLSAHKVLVSIFGNNGNVASIADSKLKDLKSHDGLSYMAMISMFAQVTASLPDLSKWLVTTLTPARARALASLSPHAVATAYLALEAGKCLVFEKQGTGFVQASQFPHLQARAILHSVAAFHQEYDQKYRQVIRQAILCSRRHGDFGRVFLPEGMPVSSRALRDWLEVLCAHRTRRNHASLATELDAHLEEIRINWQKKFKSFLVSQVQRAEVKQGGAERMISKGIVYKSVVLMPYKDVVDLALAGFSVAKVNRISCLMQNIERFNWVKLVPTDLPCSESDSVSGISEKAQEDHERWMIVKAMLMQFNWLSTRVGDDAVPANGLVFGVVVAPATDDGESAKVHGIEGLAPLRQRRLMQLFGRTWESDYYVQSFHPDDINVYVDQEEFKIGLKLKQSEIMADNKGIRPLSAV